jgi:hypothetical protein
MLKKILLAIVLPALLLLYYTSIQPDTLHVERTLGINATPEKIFPFIEDLHRWEEWTPYNKDPAMKKTFMGSPKGVGASYAWQGNAEVGQGEITITRSTPPEQVSLDLRMIKPISALNTVKLTLHRTGASTQVTWSMDCKQTVLSKVLTALYISDYLIGRDFELGLSNLKVAVENNTRP